MGVQRMDKEDTSHGERRNRKGEREREGPSVSRDLHTAVDSAYKIKHTGWGHRMSHWKQNNGPNGPHWPVCSAACLARYSIS